MKRKIVNSSIELPLSLMNKKLDSYTKKFIAQLQKEISKLQRKNIELEVQYISACKKVEEFEKRIHKETLPMMTLGEIEKEIKSLKETDGIEEP